MTAAAHNQPEPELIAVAHDGLHPLGEILNPLDSPFIQINIGRSEFLTPHCSFRVDVPRKTFSVFFAHKIQKILNGFTGLECNNLTILFSRAQDSGKILTVNINDRHTSSSRKYQKTISKIILDYINIAINCQIINPAWAHGHVFLIHSKI
jgi:hypothetical protein